jgi:putative phosphoribosyl transferase
MFANRFAAGVQLAQFLEPYSTEETVLLAVPRGGIQVAYPIALRLKKPLDVIIPRKIALPEYPELALGAVTFDGGVDLNQELVDKFNLSSADVEALVRPAVAEIRRRLLLYRGQKPPVVLAGHDVILIDDGLATGYTMIAAIRSVRNNIPRRITVAVPVSPSSTCDHIRTLVDQLVVLEHPTESSFAVGAYYSDFRDLPDEELVRLLNESFPISQSTAQSQ